MMVATGLLAETECTDTGPDRRAVCFQRKFIGSELVAVAETLFQIKNPGDCVADLLIELVALRNERLQLGFHGAQIGICLGMLDIL